MAARGSRRGGKAGAGRRGRKRSTASRKRLTPGRDARGPGADEMPLPLTAPEVAPLCDALTRAGGAPLAAYREPLSGRPLLLASLPRQRVQQAVAALRARGFDSPYLRNLVVARINPVRFLRPRSGDAAPPMTLAAALTRMTAALRRFDPAEARERDLARVAAASGD